jgi:hypothetical protein
LEAPQPLIQTEILLEARRLQPRRVPGLQVV